MDGWIPSRIKGHLLSKFRLYSAHHQDGLFRLQVEENQWIPPSLLNFFCSLGLAHRFLLVHHPSDSLDQKGRTHLLPLPPSTRYSDVDQTESLIELKTKEITIPDSMPKSIRSLASSCKAYLRDLVSCTDGPFNENDIFLNDKKIHFRKTYTEIGCDTKVLEAISQTAKNCQASLNSWDFKTQASKKDGKDPSSLEFRLRFLDANFNSSTTPKLHDWVLECLTIALDSIKLAHECMEGTVPEKIYTADLDHPFEHESHLEATLSKTSEIFAALEKHEKEFGKAVRALEETAKKWKLKRF